MSSENGSDEIPDDILSVENPCNDTSENGSDEIPVDLSSENEPESDDSSEELKPTEISIKELSKLLEIENKKYWNMKKNWNMF